MAKKDLISPAEVGRILAVSRQQICKWLDQGRIPFTRVGKYRYVDRKDAKKPQRVPPGPKPQSRTRRRRRAGNNGQA